MDDIPSDALRHAMVQFDGAVGREISPVIGSADKVSSVGAIYNTPNEGDYGVEVLDFDELRSGGRVARPGEFASGTSSTSKSDHRRTTGTLEGEGDESRYALNSESSVSPRGLSRSLIDRLHAFEEFTPFDGGPIKEQEVFEQAPLRYIHFPAVGSGARFDAAFMRPEAREPRRKQTKSFATRRTCDFCVLKKRRCDDNTPCAACKTASRKCFRSVLKAAKKPQACDRCKLRHTPCDGKKRCASCKTSHTKCVRSAPVKRSRAASKTTAILTRKDKSGQGNLEGSPLRCRRRGCLELPVHGRRSGRALWCELHYVSQDAHQPKRCPVLQQHASGDFLACWRETTWGWPGQPPTRCERHKAIGHQQQNLDEVVSVLKGIFTEVVWPPLKQRGWRLEGSDMLPPGVVRGGKAYKARVDYFHAKHMVIKYCLRTEEHHEWMMEEYRKRTRKASSTLSQKEIGGFVQESSTYAPPGRIPMDPKRSTTALQESGGMLTPGDGSDLKGISSTHRGGCLHHEQKETPEQVSRQVSPTKTRYFSHKLFSITPSPNQTEGQRAGAGDDSHNFPSNIGEIEPSPTTAHSRKRRLLQVTRTPLPVDGSRQGNHVTHQGQDTAMVTRAGFACSEQVLAGYVAQMNGGDNNAVSLGTTTTRNSERFISLQLP